MADVYAPPDDHGPTCESCGGDDMSWVDCGQCGAEGVDGHDCGEDVCCCLDPEENVRCDTCEGKGGWWICHPCATKAGAARG